MKHSFTITVTLDPEQSSGWPLKLYADTGNPDGPFPFSLGELTLRGATLSGEAVTQLILDEAKRKGIPIEEV